MPPSIMDIPTSPEARAKPSNSPEASDAPACGRETRRKALRGPQPKVRATLVKELISSRLKAASRGLAKRGRPAMKAARTRPGNEKTIRKPRPDSKATPKGLLRPKAMSRMKPKATGGNTSGRVTKKEAIFLAGVLGPESHQARGIPIRMWRARQARQISSVSLAEKDPSSVMRLESTA